MKRINEFFKGRIGRFNYLLSILIVVLGFSYIVWFCNDNRCLVCNPIMSIPWKDLLFIILLTASGGVYICSLICFAVIKEGLFESAIIISISCTLLIIVQTIRRCHDRKESGWRVFIPFYSLLLLILPGKNDNGKLSKKALVFNTLMNGKWLILVLLLLIGIIYLEYSWCFQRHKDLCSITGEPSKHDKLGGAFCPKCLSTNVAKNSIWVFGKRMGSTCRRQEIIFSWMRYTKEPQEISLQ